MAVIILGSGLTPVIGTREFCPIPGGSSGEGDVSFGSGDINDYVLTSTGVGNIIQGEANLQFNGTVLTLVGNLIMPSGNITVNAMTATSTENIVSYNTSTGAITYNASGGGTSNFLRADGTWVAPAGTGITISGTPANNQVAVWTSASDIEGATALTWDESELYTSGDLRIDGSVIYNPGMVNSASAYVVHYNPGDGSLSYTGSGVSTEYLNGNGAWTVPSGSVDIIGSPVAGDVTFFYDSDTIEGNSLLRFDSGILHVESGIETQIITELNSGYGVRLPDNVYIGRDALSNSPLTVGALSGSNPLIYIANAASGYGLQIDATSAVTAQQNILADAATNTVTRGLDILHTTSNTSAAGFGTGLTLSTEYDSGANQISAAIDTIITDPVYASGDANLSIKLNSTNTLEERFVFDSTGIFQTDTINELTASAGVTIEGVLIEDSDITLATANYLNFNVGTTTNIYDNSGVMTFTDTVTGPVTLAALATATGDVTKVGTPVDNQVGVWTGDGTLEGTTDFTYDATILNIGIPGASPLMQIKGSSTPGYTIYSDAFASTWIETFNNSAATAHLNYNERGGGTYAAQAAAPTNATVTRYQYNVHDGTSSVKAGEFIFQVDGAIATADFDTKYTWDLKEGAAASALIVTLGVDGFEYNADHSIDQAANPRWLVDKDYVDTEVAAAGGLSASGTPANDQIGVWVDASTLEGTANLTFISTTLDVNNTITVDTINEHTGATGVTIETVVLDSGGVTIPAITGTGTRIVTADTSGIIGDGNLSGQVTTTNSLATVLGVTAITDQTVIGAALISTDELLVNDDGTGLRRMDVSVLETYMQDNLSFGTGYVVISGTPADNRIAIWTNSTDIEGDSGLTWSGTVFDNSGTITVDTINEHTTDAGVSIEGIGHKDGWITVAEDDGIYFGTGGNARIREGGFSAIQVVHSGGSIALTFESTAVKLGSGMPLTGWANKGNNIGSSSVFFDNAYFDRVYIDNTSVYLDVSSTEMTFTDGSNAAVTLSSLVKGDVSFTADTGTTYTFVIGDAGKVVTLSDASAITLTVPTNASVAFPIGTIITVIQIGAGQVTISGTPTLRSADDDLKLRAQYSSATLIKCATDEWYVVGDLTA